MLEGLELDIPKGRVVAILGASGCGRPEESLLLLAPLAKAAGGYALCGGSGPATSVFATTDDADYRVLQESVLAAKLALDGMKRFDMPGFRPGPEYVRELKRFGILTRSPGDDTPMDVYATDQAYWKSHWCCTKPQIGSRGRSQTVSGTTKGGR